MIRDFFEERKFSVIFTVLVLMLGTVYYFTSGDGSIRVDPAIFEDLKLKAAYTPEGQIKIFALADSNELAKMKASDGYSIPEAGTMIIGSSESAMMIKEGKFSKVGDKIDNLFGINTTVGGVLKRTNTILDEFHFLGEQQFNQLDGEENRAFVKLKEGKEPKLFYTYLDGENSKLKFNLSEGSLSDYSVIHKIAGEKYYPLILGYSEAKMMRQEKLFSRPGDMIKGFFGINVTIVGVAQRTNTSLDMAHIIPLAEGDLK